MVKIIIDGIECDYNDSTAISLSYNGDDMVTLENGRVAQTISLQLPVSTTNDTVFGRGNDLHPQTKFNSTWHSATIEADGITLFSGTAYLMSVVVEPSERYYGVEFRGGVVGWVSTASSTLFRNIPISYSNTLTEANVKASWTNSSAVKFFPIVRDSYEDQGSAVDVMGVRVLRSIDDYHPFIQLSALITAILKNGGYTLSSSTSSKENFDDIYISGSYSSAENSAARSAMGFYARRSEACTTTTDSLGRVSMSPYDVAYTVGNFVDLETTTTETDCYNYGNVLQMDNEALSFVPLTEISVGFEYYLHYTCVCQIESRTSLKGIDTLNTVDNGSIKWEITNRYEDQRDSMITSLAYKLIIFNFEPGTTYRLMGVSSSGATTYMAELTSRMTQITLNQLFDSYILQEYDTTGYKEHTGDWAFYFGYIEEYSPVEVKITVRSSPTSYSPTSPKAFEFQMLQGAEPGVEFTLHEDCTLTPYFAEYPGYNSSITFDDIARLDYSALEFLESLQHLFNLRFSTNEDAAEVVIESFDEFYNGSTYDWSDKVISSQQVEFVDFAHSTHRSTTLGYQQTDGVVERMGESDNAYFGQWSYDVDSYAASSTSQTLLNPIFCASTSDDDGVLVVGDRDDVTTVDSLSFSPRIARYFGLNKIEGENYSLPYVSFHAPDESFTLCFEDRDSVEGLNRLYLNYVDLLRRAQFVTLSLTLSAIDYSNLFCHLDSAPSIRSRFYFEIEGESFLTILHSIESYNPSSGVARCLFLTID